MNSNENPKMIWGVFLTKPISQDTISRLKALGVNQVALGWEACQEGGTRQLRDQGIQVYAEISLFVGETLWEKYPDSRPVGLDGRPMEPVSWYYGVCPNNPGVRSEKLAQVESILDGVPVDGLWLDFIRYPCHWEAVRGHPAGSPLPFAEYCYCPHCLSKFEAEVGGKPQGEAWTAWKCAQIAGFVGQIRSLIRISGRPFSLGLFAVPWSAADYGGAIRSVIGQDFAVLAEHVDVFGVMAYHRLVHRPVNWIGEITRDVFRLSGKSTLPLVQSMDEPEKISGAEFENALRAAVRTPSEGVMVFHYEDLLGDPVKCGILERMCKSQS